MNTPDPAFANIAPTLASPTLGVYTWLCEPAGMINRIAGGVPVGTAQTEFITRNAFDALRKAFPTAQRYYFVHDFSAVEDYSAGARQALTQWGKDTQREGVVEQVVVIPPRMSALGTMAVNTAMMTLQMLGMRIESAANLQDVIDRLALRPHR